MNACIARTSATKDAEQYLLLGAVPAAKVVDNGSPFFQYPKQWYYVTAVLDFFNDHLKSKYVYYTLYCI